VTSFLNAEVAPHRLDLLSFTSTTETELKNDGVDNALSY